MDFVIVFSNEHGKVGYDSNSGIAYCKILTPYVPIEAFKNLLIETKKVVIERKLATFLFDKSELRAFHQPSMEWYYVHWKQEMYNYGLTRHRKIMPAEAWFQRCVDAGKAEIFQKYPTLFESINMDIKYVKSEEEVMS
jgi:hypothetical protein